MNLLDNTSTGRVVDPRRVQVKVFEVIVREVKVLIEFSCIKGVVEIMLKFCVTASFQVRGAAMTSNVVDPTLLTSVIVAHILI